MKVITENEIVVQKGTRSPGMYSAASGKSKKKKPLLDKAKGLVGSGKVKGFMDLFGQGGQQPSEVIVTAPEPEAKKGMSTGAKWGIGIGVAALLGIGAYFLLKKKK